MRRNYYNIDDYRMNRSAMLESRRINARRRALREAMDNDNGYFKPRSLKELYQWVHEQNDEGVDVLDVSGIDVSGLTELSHCFEQTNFREIIGLENWDVSNVTKMRSMFSHCQELIDIQGIETWDVSRVKYMDGMFIGCLHLETLDLSNWDVRNVRNMESMFSFCRSLKTLDLSNWDVRDDVLVIDMFHRCDRLRTTHNRYLD